MSRSPEVPGLLTHDSAAQRAFAARRWNLNFQRLSRRLLMVSIKDFVWEKVGGEWRTRWCPLGERMVNWPEFVRQLSQVDFDGPISLHIEYDPGGKTRSSRFENSLAAAERDLRFLWDRLDEVTS